MELKYPRTSLNSLRVDEHFKELDSETSCLAMVSGESTECRIASEAGGSIHRPLVFANSCRKGRNNSNFNPSPGSPLETDYHTIAAAVLLYAYKRRPCYIHCECTMLPESADCEKTSSKRPERPELRLILYCHRLPQLRHLDADTVPRRY